MGLWEDIYEKASSFFNQEAGETSSQIQKRCYYELLEIPRDSTEDDIKRSYKKLALKYHPDKNPGKKDECTAYFILVQQAYEVLIDPQERAFYDKHRENIINGSSPEEKRDTGLNLYPFFQKCYRGFDDGEDGFFNIYRQLFDKLASEEFPYIEDDEEKDFPSFGTSTSDYDQIVSPFYDKWLYFSTQRSFAWLDKYDLRQAEDRYSIKCMDKENKKFRDAGKKQRNEEIRNLAQFVRRRDPRVKVYREQLEERRKNEFERVEQERKKQILRNMSKFNEKDMPTNFTEEYLDDLDKIENDLNDQFGAFNVNEDGEIDPDSYYCIACEKKFKSSKSFENHQKTKAHKKAVEDLKKFMADDDKELLEEEDAIEEPTEKVPVEELVEEIQKPNGKRKKGKKKAEKADPDVEDENKHDTFEEPAQKTKKSKKKQEAPISTTVGGSTVPIEATCMICQESFESRTKLFEHIKATGHAALKETGKKKKR